MNLLKRHSVDIKNKKAAVVLHDSIASGVSLGTGPIPRNAARIVDHEIAITLHGGEPW